MIIITCIDMNLGMMFHNRRQSRDRAVRDDILRECRGYRLFMNSYSASVFEECTEQIMVRADFLKQAGEGDYCFVENEDISGCLERIQGFILYQWNRRYPADQYFAVDLEGQWELKSKEEFKGYSHERITKEVYGRK